MEEALTILIIGGGGGEHAISLAYEKSPKVKKIIISPGNDFIKYGRKKEVIVDSESSLKDPYSILKLAEKYSPDIIDVAQDDALSSGAVNLLKAKGYAVFGPTKEAAQIESDKKWSREFQARHGIPQPNWISFDGPEPAKEKLKSMYSEKPNQILWIKANGLAEGKGVIKAENIDEAYAAVDRMKDFGEAGEIFLIEENMPGEEFSIYAISDGKSWHVFKSAQDNKRVFEGDKGPNTGGMGAISPAMVTRGSEDEIESEMIAKVIRGLEKEGRPFVGVLYLGGIKTKDGLRVIEYNARWGDPEAQVVVPGLITDYVDIVKAAINGNLSNLEIQEDNKTRVCIVGASRGYPGDYSDVKRRRILGLEEVMKLPGIQVFGAGIEVVDGKFYANGGRLFSVVAEGDNIVEARGRGNYAMEIISIDGDTLETKYLHSRRDMGLRDEMRFRQVA